MKYDAVYLDLEETIITNWHDRYLINAKKLSQWLKDHGVTEIGIFSFAIYHEHDLAIFNADLREPLERVLEVKIVDVPHMGDMMRFDRRLTGVYLEDVHEYISLRGKQQGFINYINERGNYQAAALIDDVVQDLTLTYRKSGATIDFFNVNSI